MSKWLPWAGSVLTGIMLFCAFPPVGSYQAAFFALVPLFVLLRGQTARRAFYLGLAAGSIYWIASISWLRFVTWPGMVVLAVYCGLYIGLFYLLCGWWLNRFGCRKAWANLGLMAIGASAWAGLETFRSTAATGFGWNPLGLSQVGQLPVLQLASIGGISLVSWVVVFFNLGLGTAVLTYIDGRGTLKRPHIEIVSAFLVLAVCFSWGFRRVQASPGETRTARLALVQPSIPQNIKWNPMIVQEILNKVESLTQEALREPGLDLVVWPETVLPYDLLNNAACYEMVAELSTNGVPILVGSMDTQSDENGNPIYYNSSFLFLPGYGVTQSYNKQHLVIFGEYVPLADRLPFLKALTPIGASFSAGSESTLFHLEGVGDYAVLICFEDTVDGLARNAVLAGARFLVNQTNDAWFDPSWASRQHMYQSAARAVELGVPVIRCGNSGASCVIDGRGRVADLLTDEHGHIGRAGILITEAEIPVSYEATPFARNGNLFGRSMLFCTAALYFVVFLDRLRVKQAVKKIQAG